MATRTLGPVAPRSNKLFVVPLLELRVPPGIAQRQRSRFSPSGPRFESQLAENFSAQLRFDLY